MSLFDSDTILQTPDTIKTTRILKRGSKREFISAMKKEKVEAFLTELPKPNESYHIVSNGSFDFYTFIPIVIGLMKSCNSFYGSTWTMNRGNVLDMLQLFDNKKIKTLNVITGLYFKQRESSVYAQLVEGILEREQRYICLENHAKITLFENGTDFITIEGSANFTSNPRIEQYVMTNSKELFKFHQNWMDEILTNAKGK